MPGGEGGGGGLGAELELKEACLAVLGLLARKAKDRHPQLEEACAAAVQKLDAWSQGSDPEREVFPAEAVTYCLVLTMDGVEGNKKWNVKKETKAVLLRECVEAMTRLIDEGLITTHRKFDFLPGSATGVGKPLVAAVMETLVQHTGCKRAEVVVAIVKAIESLVASNHYGSGTLLLEVVCQTLFRLHICGVAPAVQGEANSALQNGLLSIQQKFEDLCHVRHQAAEDAACTAAVAAACLGAGGEERMSGTASPMLSTTAWCSPERREQRADTHSSDPHLTPTFGPGGFPLPHSEPPSPLDDSLLPPPLRAALLGSVAAVALVTVTAVSRRQPAASPLRGVSPLPFDTPSVSDILFPAATPTSTLGGSMGSFLWGAASTSAAVAAAAAVLATAAATPAPRVLAAWRCAPLAPSDADVISRSFQQQLHIGTHGAPVRSRTPHAFGGGGPGWGGAPRTRSSSALRPGARGHTRTHSSGVSGSAPWTPTGRSGPAVHSGPRLSASSPGIALVMFSTLQEDAVAAAVAAAASVVAAALVAAAAPEAEIDAIFSATFVSATGANPVFGTSVEDDMNLMFQPDLDPANNTNTSGSVASHTGAGASAQQDDELELMLRAAWGDPTANTPSSPTCGSRDAGSPFGDAAVCLTGVEHAAGACAVAIAVAATATPASPPQPNPLHVLNTSLARRPPRGANVLPISLPVASVGLRATPSSTPTSTRRVCAHGIIGRPPLFAGDTSPGVLSPRSVMPEDIFSDRVGESPSAPAVLSFFDDDFGERDSLSQSAHSQRRWSASAARQDSVVSSSMKRLSARNTPNHLSAPRSNEHVPAARSISPGASFALPTSTAAELQRAPGEVKEAAPGADFLNQNAYVPVEQPGVTVRKEQDLLLDVRSRPIEYDLYSLLSTFCRLGVEDISQEAEVDSVRVQSRAYALELLVFCLSHAGSGFARSLSLVSSLKGHIARAVVLNLATTRPLALFELALQVVSKLPVKVGRYMRAETAGLLLYVLLPICRSPMASFSQRVQVIDAIAGIFGDQRTLAELFLNHDGTGEGNDVVCEIVATLSFVCTHVYTSPGWYTLHQDTVTAHRAADALCTLLTTLQAWAANTRAAAAPSEPQAAAFRAVYANKLIMRALYTTWQTSSKKGVELLVSRRVVPDGAAGTIARFLYDNALSLRLQPSQTGDLLLRHKPWNTRLLLSYVALFDMKAVPIGEALRQLLSQFHPMGEAQIMERLMWAFVSEYAKQNEQNTMFAPTGTFEKDLKVMLHGSGFEAYVQDAHPLLANVLSETATHVTVQLDLRYHELPDNADMVAAKAREKEQPVMTVEKQHTRKLDFGYFISQTLLFINTQNANQNVKQCDKRSAQDYIGIAMGHTECTLSAEAVEAIITPVFDEAIALSKEYDRSNKYETVYAVQYAYEEMKAKEREGEALLHTGVCDSAAAKQQHKAILRGNAKEQESLQARWREMEARLEISPEPMMVSGLPLEKAIAKAYERGVKQLGRVAFETMRSGTQLKGMYVDSPTRREHVWLVYQCVWPAMRVAFDRILRASKNAVLLRRVSQCYTMAGDLAAALALSPQALDGPAVAAVHQLHQRWADYHRLTPREPPQAHPVGVLHLLHEFSDV
eukprot:TRINITY_DN8214_c0_g1_i1.p1 TRINITY_DN8214_c0_g1~~TRINITY_DN8214_c0_g1_i1.p1  ORF type:complete len:1617 (+),score=490.40 TRINITY_DN8214_c0_g1_i1:91-4941(+)